MRFRRPDIGEIRNLSFKTVAKIVVWPIASFFATYGLSIAIGLPRKLETSLFVSIIFLILGIKHTRKEKRESRPEKAKQSQEGESFFTKPWPPAKK